MFENLLDKNSLFIIQQSQIILNSYRHWKNEDLIARNQDPKKDARDLFESSMVVASSNNSKDPVLNYGNAKALNLWELTWEEFTKTLGKNTAEVMEQSEREKFLYLVKKNGFIEDYQGIRISSTGKRFQISKATVWNLLDENKNYCGQAATFTDWNYL